MPKQGAGGGCRVTGKILGVDGSPLAGAIVTIRSERGGVWEGAVYSRLSTRVAVGKQGELDALLPPSSAVGVYMISFANSTYRVWVPDSSSADLAELIKRGN